MRGSLVFSLGLLLGFCQLGAAQDVISASSGVLQYFEGSVEIDHKPVEHKAGVFPSLKNGSLISTAKGRAELLLTPGAYLRMDEDTSLRMESNSLTDTRLELTQGIVIFDSLNASSNAPVTLHLQGASVQFPKPGIYRLDADLSELEAFSGEAKVTHEDLPRQPVTSTVDSSHLYYFGLGVITNKFGDGAMDEFYDWARNRSEIIAQQNETASAEQDQAEDPDPGATAGLLGIPPVVPSPNAGAFGSIFGSTLQASAIDPLFLNPVTPFPAFFPSYGIILFTPLRHWPVGTKWPTPTGITAGYHPLPVSTTHWPTATHSGYYVPGSLRLGITSTYRPGPVTSPIITVPRLAARPITAAPAARPMAVHIGHR